MAPEIIQALGHGKTVDIWCIGVLLFEMVCGCAPFQSDDPFEVCQLTLKLSYTCSDHIAGSTADLIAQLLQRNPDDRIGC